MPAVKLRGSKRPVVRAHGLRQVVKAAKSVSALSGGYEGSKGAAGELGVRLLEAGEYIAAIARTNASWSTRIPASVRVGGGMSGVVVRAGSKAAPNAYPFEVPGVRHPVFGRPDIPWEDNENRPFMVPAAEEGAVGAAEIVARVIEDWGADYGFR